MYTMAECACCQSMGDDRYHLTSKTGKPMQLGKIVKDLLEEEVNRNVHVVCQKCRGQLLHVEKLKYEYEELTCKLKKSDTKSRFSTARTRIRLSTAKLPHYEIWLTCSCSLSTAQSTGISPAEKRPALRLVLQPWQGRSCSSISRHE